MSEDKYEDAKYEDAKYGYWLVCHLGCGSVAWTLDASYLPTMRKQHFKEKHKEDA